ncbi:EAL domain-containing protein [Undibacterium sp. 5I1]|uniref:putative bifunctional diguanylate cyclase/phosphodiesterase n=1 Tax=unclassified Undibacterium TaxID=2630295 RepID=UPI002AB4AB6C|nr:MULTISPECIES: EAL domain-containing protein [unclassified Undibacterium]MDY7539119.1 EAL domain-containing protein [Undibacterium sp. 5I1]MEB0229746.1 EAL domain-containing protein [Undibacterium sp. 10I3]MEB0259285.1 EAL domain-containing protein [Undibacterium sp. 5I1]
MTTFFQWLRHIILMPKRGQADLQQWRTDVLSAIVFVGFGLGLITAIPSIALAIKQGLWSVVAIDVIALAWIACLWRLPQLSFKFRAWNLVVLLYFLGIWFLIKVGPVSQIYLMAFPVMTALLIGFRPAVVALIVNAVTLLGIGYLAQASIHVDHLSDQPLVQWMIITLNFTFISSILTVSCGVLLQRLEQSLAQQLAVATSLKDEQSNLRDANAALRLNTVALARLNDMVLILKADTDSSSENQIVFVNDAFERKTGYRLAEIVGKTRQSMHGAKTQLDEINRIAEALDRGEAVHTELINYTKSGEEFWVETDIVPMADESGKISHWVVVERDITDRKNADEHIHRLAYFDVLTGLPNRRLLIDRLDILLATARRTGLNSAVLFIDLDHFKNINDARGHAIGDSLLLHVTQRLKTLLREVDTVARIGGDEFVVLISNISNDINVGALSALAVAEKIRSAVALPFEIDGQAYNSSCSIGVTLLPKPDQDTNDLLREADTAMHRAKAAGRNQIVFFESTMQAEVEQRLILEHDLVLALNDGQFQMVMQAQVNHEGQPEGAELLMRWTHPQRGPISPAVFIPVAEECGMIVQLGDWALRQGCLALIRLEQAGWPLSLSVNVSPKQFRQANFVDKVAAVLMQTGAPASRLILEVTEGLLINNMQETIERMHALTKMGIRFSIDDFGTGYSSLAYLKKMPLYELKIDRSFVQDMPADPNDTAIVQAILSMANHLGLRVVAEGVETQEQADFLISSGCSSLQGFFYCRPLPIETWLKQQDEKAQSTQSVQNLR